MAHKKKYYKEIESHGHKWRLEIWQDTTATVSAVEIGPVLQGLRLVMQGDQADIDTPIIKTSLEMVFIDAPDLATSRKCGYWEEFYTSSATEYQVRLYKDNAIEWTGYVTPDSFSEDLRYRGSVSIIARDNLGTLQDTTCDLTRLQNIDGKVRISQIIQEAIKVSTCAMEYGWNEEAFPSGTDVEDEKYEMSGNAMWQMLDTTLLHEMNWWNVLEKVLYSIGAVLRYVGGNKLWIAPLRDLPKCGEQYWWNVPTRDVKFVSYGHRELVPGIKSIVETQEWNVEIKQEAERISEYNETSTRSCTGITLYGPTETKTSYNIPLWGYINPKTKEEIPPTNSNLLNVKNYPKLKGEDSEQWGAWDDDSIIYYALGVVNYQSISFKKKVYSDKAKVSINMIIDKPVTLTSDYAYVLNLPIKSASTWAQNPVLQYKLKLIGLDPNDIKYYNGNSWTTSVTTRTLSISAAGFFQVDITNPVALELKDITIPNVGTIELEVVNIVDNGSVYLRRNCVGAWVRLKDIRIDITIPEEVKLLQKLTLTTNYSDKYAVRLTRQPEFAVNATLAPEVTYLPNAILTEGWNQYSGAGKWIWGESYANVSDYPDDGISLSRLIHQQLLAYHSAPQNLLSGELVAQENGDISLSSLYRWGGKDHILLSGTHNILTGRIESAVLREFIRYDRMWEMWAEKESYSISSAQQNITVQLRNVESFSEDDIKQLPTWITYITKAQSSVDKTCNVLLRCMQNSNSASRSAVVQIGTVFINVKQAAASVD